MIGTEAEQAHAAECGDSGRHRGFGRHQTKCGCACHTFERTLNEVAAEWWAARFSGDKAALKAALLKRLPDSDWQTYNDYDPEGLLLDALREVQECRGFMFSGDGLFPRKTGLRREGKYLYSKEGYGASWREVPRG